MSEEVKEVKTPATKRTSNTTPKKVETKELESSLSAEPKSFSTSTEFKSGGVASQTVQKENLTVIRN